MPTKAKSCHLPHRDKPPKSDQDDIDKSDERDFKELAAVLLNASDEQLADLVESGKYQEVQRDGRN